MNLETFMQFAGGIVLLILGADLIVRGASRLAAAIGISPLVIGLTVVAFGTSSPELAVSLKASLSGEPDIALGNVVGSNIFNVLFILGLSALITPLTVAQQLVRLDVPLVIVISILLLVLAFDGHIGRLDGLLLFSGLLVYTTFVVRQSLRESAEVKELYQREYGQGPSKRRVPGWLIDTGLVLAGLGMLLGGSHWLVTASVSVAQAFGISELVIGLTIIAAGTSLPEVATSVMASIKGERDIAVGNVIGSSIFNILAILGLTGMVSGEGIAVAPAALNFDIPVMIATSIACLPIFFTGYRIGRREGLLFFAMYLSYTAYLIMDASGHDALPAFSTAMGMFVLPLIAVTLGVLYVRALRQNHSSE